MAKSDREVFEYFRRDPKTTPEVDALAYASFAFDKHEWSDKFETLMGRPPTAEEIDRWIGELPDSRLNDLQRSALAFFRKTVTNYVNAARETAFRNGAQDAMVQRVVEATSFWRNLPGNIAVGVASSFAFALLLILASLLFDHDPSPIALYQKYIAPATEAGPAPK